MTSRLRRWYRRLPGWAQGLASYAAVVLLVCAVPLVPAWLAILIGVLVTLSATWQIRPRGRAAAGYDAPMSTGKYLRRLAAAVFTSAFVFGGLTAATAASVPPVLTPVKAAGTVPSATVGIWNGSPGSVPAGAHPDVMADYLYYGTPFPSQFASRAAAAGATALVEMEPWQGGGTADCSSLSGAPAYYEGIGAAVKAGGRPVILEWGHEQNVEGQYPWAAGNGCGFTQADWVSEWRDVVGWVRSAAGGLAYFMWAPGADTCPGQSCTTHDPSPWWPGAATVDMTGLDGYPAFCDCGTFARLFAPTFKILRALPGFGSLPQQKVFIAETDLAPLGSPGYESLDSFTADLCQAGGDGVLQFQDGTPPLSYAQWGQLQAGLTAHCGSTPPVTPAPTVTPAVTPVPSPTQATPPPGHHRRHHVPRGPSAAQLAALHAWHVKHLAHEARLRWLHMLYAG